MKQLPKNITVGDKYKPAIYNVTNQKEADEYFEILVQHDIKYFNKTREEAIEIEKGHLAYFAGYYDNETRERVERLFKCSHPIFGSIAEVGSPSPEEAFEMGRRMGEKSK